MSNVKYWAVLLSLLLLFPLSVWAKGKDQHSVTFSDPVQIGTTQLNPGNYKVEWMEDGPAVHVKFMQHGKTLATVPATLKTNDSQVTEDDIVTHTTKANAHQLEELDFSHHKEALLFGTQPSGM